MSLNDYLILSIIILLILNGASPEINLSPYASWDQNGITVAGWQNGTNESSLSQLNQPIGISVTSNDVMYIGDTYNHRIVVVQLDSPTSIFTIGSGPGSNSAEFNQPFHLFVTNISLYVTDWGNHRVQNLSLDGSDASTVLDITGLNFPSYLYVDHNNNIYLSDTGNHTVLLFLSNSTIGSVVAGSGVEGSNDDQLNRPYGIFVNHDGTIYIADRHNHRIMKWVPRASSGILVAGDRTPGTSSTQLNSPTQILVDRNGYMYISDAGNNRIIRWAPNWTCGVCIVACSGGSGTASTQLNDPHSLAFDSHGSLYVSDYKNHRVQKFQILQQHISYNQPKICPSLTWDTCGITFAGESVVGQCPRGIFIDYHDNIYAADHSNGRISVWASGNANLKRTLSVNLYTYTSLFVTINGDIYFENGDETGQIDKWSKGSNESSFVIKFTGNCDDLFIDVNDTLYCSIRNEHRVAKVSFNSGNKTGTTAAGTGAPGNAANELNHPWGIFVDINFNLYVVDTGNNRIQRFRRGQTNAETVAGNGIPNNLTLNHPTDVILDADGSLYIVDNENHRIIRSGNDSFQCIVGCTGQHGSASNDLYKPYAIRFDRYGNLYVADEFNHRIQKFTLSHNSCGASTTDISTVKQTTSSSLISSLKQQQATSTSTVQASRRLSPSFVAPICPNSTNIGHNCNTSGTLCDLYKPCKNNSTCYNTDNSKGYYCRCSSGFSGTHCESDYRLCQENTCWNNGTCNNTSNTELPCLCVPGWDGIYCEKKFDYCHNITCQNKGVCRSVSLSYSCDCLGDSFSGRHCEFKSKKLVIRQRVSTSFGYIGIIAMASVAMFVIIMDILKYCFGIDPVHEERERVQREKQAKKRKPVIQRFVYVNAPPVMPAAKGSIEGTAV